MDYICITPLIMQMSPEQEKDLMVLRDSESRDMCFSYPDREWDDDTFVVMYAEFANELLAYGTGLGFGREQIKDAIHDLFFKLYREKKFLARVMNHKAYIFRAFRNMLINSRLTDKRRGDTYEYDKDSTFSIRVTVIDEMIREEERMRLAGKIEKYLSMLTNRQREAVFLRFMHELDYEEIGEMLDMSPGAVRKLVHRGISRIRESNPLVSAIVMIPLGL